MKLTAAQLRVVLFAFEISQSELAVRLNVSQVTINGLLRQRHSVSRDTRDALEATVNVLLQDRMEMYPEMRDFMRLELPVELGISTYEDRRVQEDAELDSRIEAWMAQHHPGK